MQTQKDSQKNVPLENQLSSTFISLFYNLRNVWYVLYWTNKDIIILLLLLLLLLLHVLWKKKVKLQSFVNVCSNKLPWNWSWHIKYLHYPCSRPRWLDATFFRAMRYSLCTAASSPQTRERDVCIVPLLMLCSCVHLHIFLFYSDTWKWDVLTTLAKDVHSYFRFYS